MLGCAQKQVNVGEEPISNPRIVGKNEAACAADAAREVVERWLPND